MTMRRLDSVMLGVALAVAMGGCDSFKEVGSIDDAGETGSAETGGPDDAGAAESGTGSADPGTGDPGETESGGPESTGGSEAGAGTTDGAPDLVTCPVSPTEDADCPEVFDTCEAEGDFACECVCGCDDPDPSGPGFWECEYTRYEELVEVVNATVTLDCEALSASATIELLLHNEDGSSDVVVTPADSYGLSLVGPDGTNEAGCGGLLSENGASVEVPQGSQAPLSEDFPSVSCNGVDTPAQLCELCGGTAAIDRTLVIRGPAELRSAEQFPIENVTIDCL